MELKKMEILTGIDKYECIREKGDPRFYGIVNAKGESNFLYFLQQNLNKRCTICMNDSGSPVHIRVMGYSNDQDPDYEYTHFIKKRMYKDGHMVDGMQQYLRTKDPIMYRGVWCFVGLYNDHWAINGLEKDWNEGKAIVRVAFFSTK
jgi:hypothetical protein